MAILELVRRIEMPVQSRFGSMTGALGAVFSPTTVTVISLPDFQDTATWKFTEQHVLDAVATTTDLWVLTQTDDKYHLKQVRLESLTEIFDMPLSLIPSDSVTRLYDIRGTLLVTGPTARRSLFVANRTQHVCSISQVTSVESLVDGLVGVITGLYGTGGVLRVYTRFNTQTLAEFFEVSLRDVIEAKQNNDRLVLLNTDNETLFCTKVNLQKSEVVAEKSIPNLQCQYLQKRYKCLSGVRNYFGYLDRGFTGFVGIDIGGMTPQIRIDFGEDAFDIAFFQIDKTVYVAYVNTEGIGAVYSTQVDFGNEQHAITWQHCETHKTHDFNHAHETSDADRDARLRMLGL